MSYTEVKLIDSAGAFRSLKELRNSHGFAARIWTSLQNHYLPFGDRYGSHWINNAQPVWDLAKRPDIDRRIRLTLLTTFDWAIVEGARLNEMADAFRYFVEQFPANGVVDHLPTIADIMASSVDDSPTGICFYGMSVGEDLWRIYDESLPEGVRDYDISKDANHWFIFAELDAYEESKS